MNDLLLQKQEFEDQIDILKNNKINIEKDISQTESELERLKDKLEDNDSDLSRYENELAKLEETIEDWTDKDEENYQEDIRNNLNPNQN